MVIISLINLYDNHYFTMKNKNHKYILYLKIINYLILVITNY